MIRHGVIAAVAALALGSVGMATDASAAPKGGHSGPSFQGSGGSMNMGAGSNVRANTSVRTGYASSGRNFTKTSWNSGRTWEGRRHDRGGWGWGPSVGIGFGYADYDYGPGYGYGYGYDYAPSVAYAGYGGGCGCGYPGGYAYGYGPAYAYAPVGIGIGFGFGGWGGGWHHHHHW